MGLLDLLKTGGKSALLDKMQRIPDGYTHVGVAQLDGGGLTVVIASEMLTPQVWDFNFKRWVELQTKLDSGLIVPPVRAI